jgi:hypothetical protein
MVNAVYAIDDFPGDALLWRIEWIGGVGYNTSVPSDPQISICLAQLPAGQTDPLSARSRSSQTKRTVRIGVGLLPYISIASVWQQRRPVITDLAASRHRLTIDTSSCRMVALGDVASVISRSSYLFGVSWPDVRRTLLVAVEQDGDPYRNTFGSSFTRFSPNDCVQAGIIKNHVSSAARSNSATWKEFERSGHGMAV